MTYPIATAPPVFSIGRVIGRGFQIAGSNFWKLTGLCLIALLISFLLTMAATLVVAIGGNDTSGAASGLFAIANLTISVMQFAFIWGAVTYAGVSEIEGRPAPFGECFSHGMRTLLPITGLFVLSSLGLLASYIIFVIPSIILSILWSVTAQALAVEKIGVFQAFSRSLFLTRGNRWPIFGLNLLIGLGNVAFIAIVLTGVGIIISAYGASLKTPSTPEAEVGPVIALILGGGLLYLATVAAMILVNACLQTSLYAELRQIKEGGFNAAAVFD